MTAAKTAKADPKVEIFFPFYVSDYDRDTSELSFEEHGFYGAILRALWTKNGKLDGSDRPRLARILRTDVATLERLWPSVRHFFIVHEDGSFEQKRLTRELEKARNQRLEASRAGLASAASRRARNGTAQPTRQATGEQLEQAPEQTTERSFEQAPERKPERAPNPSPSPSPSPSESGDPDRAPPSGNGDRTLPTATDLLRYFGLRWRETHNGRWWQQTQRDVELARALIEDRIGALPPAERKGALAELRPAVDRFLKDTRPFYVNRAHPFAALCQDYDAFRIPPASAPAAAEVPRRILEPIPIPPANARQLARDAAAAAKKAEEP